MLAPAYRPAARPRPLYRPRYRARSLLTHRAVLPQLWQPEGFGSGGASKPVQNLVAPELLRFDRPGTAGME